MFVVHATDRMPQDSHLMVQDKGRKTDDVVCTLPQSIAVAVGAANAKHQLGRISVPRLSKMPSSAGCNGQPMQAAQKKAVRLGQTPCGHYISQLEAAFSPGQLPEDSMHAETQVRAGEFCHALCLSRPTSAMRSAISREVTFLPRSSRAITLSWSQLHC